MTTEEKTECYYRELYYREQFAIFCRTCTDLQLENIIEIEAKNETQKNIEKRVETMLLDAAKIELGYRQWIFECLFGEELQKEEEGLFQKKQE